MCGGDCQERNTQRKSATVVGYYAERPKIVVIARPGLPPAHKKRGEDMISGDLFPSYLLKVLGALFVFCAIFATDEAGALGIHDERVLWLALAYLCASAAWYISTHHANKWLRLWIGRSWGYNKDGEREENV